MKILPQLLVLLTFASCPLAFAQGIPTDEATAPVRIVSPEFLVPGTPEAGAFIYPMVLRIDDEVLLFVQGGIFHTHGPPGTCLGDKIELFSAPATFRGLREPFQYEGAVSPCSCFSSGCPDSDKKFYELGSVFQAPHDGLYYLAAGIGSPDTVFQEGHFKELILARSTDGRTWDFLDGLNPIVQSSTVCDPDCRFISLLQPELVPGDPYWWGFFSWGYAEPGAQPDRVGAIRIYPDSPTVGEFEVQIQSGGIFRDLLPDGSFDFTPDTVAFDGIGSQIVEGEQGELVVLQGELRSEGDASGGCDSDGFPTLGSGLRYRVLEETSLSSSSRLTSRSRSLPTRNVTGFGSYTLLEDDNNNVLMLGTTSDSICQEDPTWPPGGNVFVGIDIVSSTVVPPDLLVRDSFGILPPLRELGDQLAGSSTEIGGALWTTVGDPLIGDNEITGDAVGSFVGRVDLGGLLEFDEVTVSALVSQGGSFAAVGFFADSTAGLWSPGSVAVVSKPSQSTVEIWGNGNSEVIEQIAFPVQPGVKSELALTLDTTANLLSAWVDGVIVLDRFSLGTLGVQPSAEIAGFHLNGATTGVSSVDFFEIHQGEAAIFSDGFETGDTSRWDDPKAARPSVSN